MKLNGKVAIITGGGTGIGRATAVLFAKEGARVMVIGRRIEPLQETVSLIKKKDMEASFYSADVSRRDDVENMVAETIKKYEKIDILFNNAAIFTANGKTILELDEEEWDSSMDVNLKSVFLCSKYVIPHMIKNCGGVVINCSSVSGLVGQLNQVAYNTAKGGIEIFTKCIALDFAKYNIRANTVCPGWVEIDSNREFIKQSKNEILKMNPIGRVGQPEEISKAVLFLASCESSYMTGTSLIIDGGYTAQ